MPRSKGLQLVISGAPASGKGTQCELIKETYGVVHLSTGSLLRDAGQDPNSQLGKTAKEYMDTGRLVPDDVITGVVLDRLGQTDCLEKGWLLDGFPRTGNQAEALAEAGVCVDRFIFLEVPDSALVGRAVGRRSDPQTGKIYHMTTHPPETEEIAARLVQRDDDTEEKVKVRLKQYHKHTVPVLKLYEQELLCVDGSGEKEGIFARIKLDLDRVGLRNVVFVLGGPGSGKGTVCSRISSDLGYTHLSSGDLLREEQAKGSPLANVIADCIKDGKLVPAEVIVDLLLGAMQASSSNKFLVDGFPRSQDNLDAWFKKISQSEAMVRFALFIDCPEEDMKSRLLERGKTSGRADDNLESALKRFKTFQQESLPVAAAFDGLGMLRRVLTDNQTTTEVVYARARRVFDGATRAPLLQRTLGIIKPRAVAEGKVDEIIKRVEAEGFVVVASKTETVATGEAEELLLSGGGGGGPLVKLCLEKAGAIEEWRRLIGQSPAGSLARDFGQDAFHGSADLATALREISLCFPSTGAGASGGGGAGSAPFPSERTLAMIKPGTAELHAEAILDVLAAQGFVVERVCTQTLTPAQAEYFYAEHLEKAFFPELRVYMTGGRTTALLLLRPGAIKAWRALMGPTNTIKARKEAPETLRAMFGVDATRNATHGSDSQASALREAEFWFPGSMSGPKEAKEEQVRQGGRYKELMAYMKKEVDPVMGPVLQQVLDKRPQNVAAFVAETLTAKLGPQQGATTPGPGA